MTAADVMDLMKISIELRENAVRDQTQAVYQPDGTETEKSAHLNVSMIAFEAAEAIEDAIQRSLSRDGVEKGTYGPC
jgi:hypothetical protein